MDLAKTVTFLALTALLTVPAYSQILTIGANCAGYNNKNQILSVVFDTTSRKLVFYTNELDSNYNHATHVSGELMSAPRFEDRQNPLQIVNAKDQSVSRVLFSTKNSISVSSSRGTFVYRCQAYFPGQVGMRY